MTFHQTEVCAGAHLPAASENDCKKQKIQLKVVYMMKSLLLAYIQRKKYTDSYDLKIY